LNTIKAMKTAKKHNGFLSQIVKPEKPTL